MTLERRAFGNTGLTASALGLGAAQLGDERVSDDQAKDVIDAAIEVGITLFDTARSYGRSEHRLGRFLGSRRADVVLSTKLGYGVDGVADWTGPCVTAGIEQALRRLVTDVIDIVHLHSCPLDVLERGEVTDALMQAQRAGKIRVAAYSGDNEALAWAARHGPFGSIQTSINVCEQAALRGTLARAHARGLGVIAKRPLANGFWRHAERPHGVYGETYWARWQEMDVDTGGMPLDELAVRFAAWQDGVSCCIAGTASPAHLRHNAELVARGPLDGEMLGLLQSRFDQHGRSWRQET
jgi:aryl-alcohol dehydrogenase-like predicted oxidoreductase